jgi:hypothetical protein
MDLRDCCIIDFNYDETSTNNAIVTSFIKLHEKSLKKLYFSLSRPADWTFIGNLKEMRLEEIRQQSFLLEAIFLYFFPSIIKLNKYQTLMHSKQLNI